MNRYLRFKDIPENESSNIYRGDVGIVGREIGTSCIELDDDMKPIIPIKIQGSKVIVEKGVITFLNDFSWLLGDFISGRITGYIVTGDRVGTGSDSEPLLKNIKILKPLKPELNYILPIDVKIEGEPNISVTAQKTDLEILTQTLKELKAKTLECKVDKNIKKIYDLIDKL